MKGKNNKNRNDDKKARKPVVNEQALNTEVLASPESNPTNDFMTSPVEEPKKSVTLNDLAEIDPDFVFALEIGSIVTFSAGQIDQDIIFVDMFI